jgi:hypothetical protein
MRSTARVTGRRVSRESLGAWILKCNPAVTDLPGLIEHGVDTWCVQHNYRVELFAPGQRVFLWVSGPVRATHTPGIWASGQLTDLAQWRDTKLVVPLKLSFLSAPIPRSLIAAHPDLADLEVLSQPQMSNPSFITRTQLATLDELNAAL